MKNIVIEDLDALPQLVSWLQSTQKETEKEFNDIINENTKQLISMIKTAILINGELIVFHANIFDGVYFLNITPQYLQKALGRNENEKLPIKILTSKKIIDNKYEELSKLNTSAKRAMCEEEISYEWLYNRVHNYKCINRTEFDKSFLEKQKLWIEAIESGIIEMKEWSKSDFPIKEMLMDAVQKINDLPEELHKILCEVLNLKKNSINLKNEDRFTEIVENSKERLETPDELYSKSYEEIINNTGELEDKRAIVLEFIDKICVDIKNSDEVRYAIFMFWNKAYMRAIAKRHNAEHLSFFDKLQLKNNNQYLSLLNLENIPESKYDKLKELFNHKKDVIKNKILISGDLIENIRMTTPEIFRFIENIFSKHRSKQTKKETTQNDIYNIAITLENFNSVKFDIRKTKISIFKRMVLLGLPATFIAMIDSGVLNNRILKPSMYAIIVLILGIPWDELFSLWSLRKSNISAQINIYK